MGLCVCVCRVISDTSHRLWSKAGEGDVVTGGGDMWDCAPCCLTRALPHFTLWTLNVIQILEFAKGDRFPQEVFWDYSCRTEIHASNLISRTWSLSYRCYSQFSLGLSWGGGKLNIIARVEKETWPSSRLVCHHAVLFCTFSFEPSAISKNISYTVEICQTIFDGIYFKKPIEKGLLF